MEPMEEFFSQAVAPWQPLLLSGGSKEQRESLARRLLSLLPALSTEQAEQLRRTYHTASGATLQAPSGRPFRAPHHPLSALGLCGKGAANVPSETTLASFGVLFLDDVFEFRKHALRQLGRVLSEASARSVAGSCLLVAGTAKNVENLGDREKVILDTMGISTYVDARA